MSRKKFTLLQKNAIFNIIYSVLNAIFPLISTSYASHILLASGIGKVSYAQNIVQYFVMLAPLGILNYGTKKIAEFKDNNRERDKVFSELFLINFVSTSICIFLYYLFVLNNPFFEDKKLLYTVSGMTIFFNYFNVEWFYKGEEEFKYITIRSFIVKILSFISLLIFVKNPDDYWKYALIYALAVGGNNIFNFVRLKFIGVNIKLKGISPLSHMEYVFVLLFNTLAGEIYTLLDTTMLGTMCGDDIVAYYSNPIKLIKVWVTIVTAMCGVLLPRISYYKRNNKIAECNDIINRVIEILFIIIIPSILGLITLSESIIIALFGKTFLPSIDVLKIAAFLVLPMGLSFLFGTQILIPFDCEKQLLKCTLIGMISNVFLNFMLIPIYKAKGAIIASVVCEYLVMISTAIYANRCIKLKFNIKNILYLITFSIIMGLFVYGSTIIIKSNILKIVVGVSLGVLIYFKLCFKFYPNFSLIK